MKLKPGRIILAVLVLLLLIYGVRTFIVWRSPPQLQVQVDERVPAGTLFEFLVTANKDVLMTLRSGAAELSSSGTAWSVHLPGTVGESQLTLSVVDKAGNEVEQDYTVTGVAAPELTLLHAADLVAGDPLAAWLQVDPGEGFVREATVLVAGEPAQLHDFAGGHLAFLSAPFSLDAGEVNVQAQVTDEFGRVHSVGREVPVRPIERPVEVLQLPAEALALQTDENARVQAERLEAAMAGAENAPLWDEPFIMPISGFASSGYGDPRRYFAGGEVSYHLGADLAAPTGTPVRATNDGVVVLAETLPVAGAAVVIDHGGGISSRYYHLSLIQAAVGERVQRGDIIGEVGSTGLSTGPHLHWEMRVGAEPSNPLPWADRLLPGIDNLPDQAGTP